MERKLILVDAADRPVGGAVKLKVHEEGALHRAFSVFVFNDRAELLLQQRAPGKYHSGGLWSNTCCGHPWEGEETASAAHVRLGEEMGFHCPLTPVGSFVYRARVSEAMVEHEYDHLYVGRFNRAPVPNAEEVAAWAWIGIADLLRQAHDSPHRFTAWLLKLLDWAGADGLHEWARVAQLCPAP
jgi:isopentenyl-diphosphate delta-isomerase